MSAHHFVAAVAQMLLSAAGGSGFGWGYFASLRRWSAAYLSRAPAVNFAAAALARIAAAAVFFTLAAHWGALSLLASFLGFLLARTVAVRAERAERAAP